MASVDYLYTILTLVLEVAMNTGFLDTFPDDLFSDGFGVCVEVGRYLQEREAAAGARSGRIEKIRWYEWKRYSYVCQ